MFVAIDRILRFPRSATCTLPSGVTVMALGVFSAALRALASVMA